LFPVSLYALVFIVIAYCVARQCNWCSADRGQPLASSEDSTSSTDSDFLESIVDEDAEQNRAGAGSAAGGVFTVTKSSLSRIRKASVGRAVELGSLGAAATMNSFSRVLGSDDCDDYENEDFCEIVL
jgi:hypothetical protein